MEETTSEAVADEQPISEPEVSEGNPETEPAEQEGHSDEAQSADEDPPQESSDGGYEKRYKDLQAEFTRRTTEQAELNKRLESYGGLETLENTLRFIQQDKDFQELIQQKSQPQEPQYDEDTKKALDIVDQRAQKVVEDIVNRQVAPWINKIREREMSGIMTKMDDAYDNWRDYRSDMAELARALPTETQMNPTYEDMEDLFVRAVRKKGDLGKIGAKFYEKNLAAKKSKSTGKPNTAAQGKMPKPSSMLEALRQASEATGVKI